MIFYYGGKFNPITRGHIGIISKVAEILNDGDGIVIGVRCESKDDYACRKALIEVALEETFGDGTKYAESKFLDRVAIVHQAEASLWRFLEADFTCKTLRGGNTVDSSRDTIKIILGEDEYKDLRLSFNDNGNIEDAPWRFAKEICDKYAIIHYPRVDGVSSTAVRSILHKDPCVSYSTVERYITYSVWRLIEESGLYEQAGFEDEFAQEERIAIAKYDPKKYEQPSATADIIAFRVLTTGPMRHAGEILLIRRKNFPYKGFWALPGGFLDVKSDMTIEQAAQREFKEETSVDYAFMPHDQFRTYSDMGSDPRCRIVDTVFVADMTFFKNENVQPKAADDAAQLEWFPLSSLPRLAFNHRKIIEGWITTVENRRDFQHTEIFS